MEDQGVNVEYAEYPITSPSLAAWVKARRELLSMPRARDLAQRMTELSGGKVFVDPNYIAQLERGRIHVPGEPYRSLLAQALRTTPEDILRFAGQLPPNSECPNEIAVEEAVSVERRSAVLDATVGSLDYRGVPGEVATTDRRDARGEVRAGSAHAQGGTVAATALDPPTAEEMGRQAREIADIAARLAATGDWQVLRMLHRFATSNVRDLMGLLGREHGGDEIRQDLPDGDDAREAQGRHAG